MRRALESMFTCSRLLSSAMLLMALALTACGGGSTPQNPVASASVAMSPSPGSGGGADTELRSAQTASVGPTSEVSWTLCATENGACNFSGNRVVRYGSGTQLVEKTLNGPVTCSNAVFGDPAPYTQKNCWLAQEESSAETWVVCATENGGCAFDGLRLVRYGTATQFFTRELTGPVNCNNWTFGDPAVGTVKSCSYASSGWQRCANEGGQCSFEAMRDVRYGTLAASVVKPALTSTACNNGVFGDPAIGQGKTCWYSLVATAATAPAPSAPSTPATTGADVCEMLPALPVVPSNAVLVTSFCPNGKCAKPDDDIDDTDAIDQALDQSAGKFVVFPPGKYLIKRSLRVKKAGITMWGAGATIHATNWDDQSIIVESDNTSIYGFKLTAVTAQRGSRAEHTRIAIYGPSGNPNVKNTIIRNNQIVNAGAPGTNLANSATSVGIFVNAADGFLVAGNTVVRSLADGIHVTGGARNGRILDNTVRETGDDMIALVSYAYPDPFANIAATIATNFSSSVDTYQDRNVLVANNRLSGQYWGRGIAVVGGRDITIRSNTLQNLPYGAAILLARETQSGTYGLANVLVEKNVISDVQTLNPPYDFEGKFASHGRTGHGAIEVHSSMFVDELIFPAMLDGFGLSNLAIRNNTVTSSATPAVRLGVDSGNHWTMGTRPVNGTGPMRNLSIDNNTLAQIAHSTPIQILSDSGIATCMGDTHNGNPLTVNRCEARAPLVATPGATLTCVRP